MGRKGSRLIPFLEKALMKKHYSNLVWEDKNSKVFRMNFPHKTHKLDDGSQRILFDWYELKKRNYRFFLDYTEAKQGMTASLRKSDFLERIKSSETQLVYQILNADKVLEKKDEKKRKKLAAKRSKEQEVVYDFPSSVSSGYGSGVDSPPFLQNENENMLLALQNDHFYCKNSFDPAFKIKEPDDDLNCIGFEDLNYLTNGQLIPFFNIELKEAMDMYGIEEEMLRELKKTELLSTVDEAANVESWNSSMLP